MQAIVSVYPADSPVIVPVTISLHWQRVTSQHSSFRPSSFLTAHSPSEGPHLRHHNWDITTSLQIMALVMATQLSDVFHINSTQWKCKDLNFKSLLYSHLYLSSNINICPCRNQVGKYNYRLRWILSIKTFSVSQPDSRSLSFSTINSIIYYIKICVVYYIGNKTRRKASFM